MERFEKKTELAVGRLAPSPTGAQHLGNARTFLLAWLSMRNQNGKVILRVEDLDSPRVKPWAQAQAIEDLHWLGLDWDIGPEDNTTPEFPARIQSRRLARYSVILNQLIDGGFLYPCTCTRREVEESASAPHEANLDGVIYPGTCARRPLAEQQKIVECGAPFAWRFRMPDQELKWSDGFLGDQCANLQSKLGDFVVGRPNEVPAYQLAVVVDDHDMDVTEVVRGNDLVASTFRQLTLYRALDWRPPQFIHVPLLVGPDGRRLAKRHGDTRLSTLRDSGITSQSVIGYLAWTAGLQSTNRPAAPRDFLGKNPFSQLSSEHHVVPFLDAVAYFR